jgi:hypothetical protein
VVSPPARRDPVFHRGSVGVVQQAQLVGDDGGAGAVDHPGGQQRGGLWQPIQPPGQFQQPRGSEVKQGE